MSPVIALFTLIHVLVLVYWLGGDLGAFYGANFLIDPKRSLPERAMALKILNNIDMAPRSALILALPTGVTLAWLKGWLPLPAPALAAIVIGGLVWLALAWSVHLNHGADGAAKRIDIAIRWVVMIAVLGLGLAGLAHALTLPLFIAVKLLVLGTCVALGLLVRKQLVPLFVAYRAMISGGATAATDAAIAGTIVKTRRSVVAIWLLLLVAAAMGIATPV
jgi:hypothetical protein